MPDFEKSINIQAPKDSVVQYITKVENMPEYLPTVTVANMEDGDHVHMAVNIDGQKHEDSGYFRDKGDGGLEWGSEDHDYHGEMRFQGDERQTQVTIHLHINPPPALAEKMDENSNGDWTLRIEEGIQKALDSIKSHVEGGSQSERITARTGV